MDIEKAMEIEKTSISEDIIEQAKAFETIKVAVYENPMKCANDIIDYALTKIRRAGDLIG